MCEPERNTGWLAAAGATAGAVAVMGAAAAVAVVLAAWWPWLLAGAIGTVTGAAGGVWWLHRFVTVIAMPARPAVQPAPRLALPARVPLAIEAPRPAVNGFPAGMVPRRAEGKVTTMAGKDSKDDSGKDDSSKPQPVAKSQYLNGVWWHRLGGSK